MVISTMTILLYANATIAATYTMFLEMLNFLIEAILGRNIVMNGINAITVNKTEKILFWKEHWKRVRN